MLKRGFCRAKRVDGQSDERNHPLAARLASCSAYTRSGLFTRGQTRFSQFDPGTISNAQSSTQSMRESNAICTIIISPLLRRRGRPAVHLTPRIRTRRACREALEPVLPSMEEFPLLTASSRSARLNGSTSQGSICGSTLA